MSSEKWLNGSSDLEHDIYNLCALAALEKQAEMASYLTRMIPKPFEATLCNHDDWCLQISKNKEEFIDEFFKKWGPKDDA